MQPPSNESLDHELMTAIGKRNNEAFTILLKRHCTWALNFVERMIGSRHEAEDLVQTAFLRVWQGAASWQHNAKFNTWLYRILYNLCMDHFRTGKRMTPDKLGDDDHEAIVDERPSTEEQHLEKERGARVRAALAELPERQRAALVLCYYEELSQADAAALLEISEGALESLMSRGRKTLRKWLKSELH
jgi:RNA polymerase sigma-70 factor, ECF subfamily